MLFGTIHRHANPLAMKYVLINNNRQYLTNASPLINRITDLHMRLRYVNGERHPTTKIRNY